LFLLSIWYIRAYLNPTESWDMYMRYKLYRFHCLQLDVHSYSSIGCSMYNTSVCCSERLSSGTDHRRKCFRCAKTRSARWRRSLTCPLPVNGSTRTRRQIYLVWTARPGRAHCITIDRPEGSNPKWLLLFSVHTNTYKRANGITHTSAK